MLKKYCGWWPIWYLLFFCHGGVEGQLQWVVKEKVTDYGQNLKLFCPVKNCCSDGAGWSVGFKTLILDVKTFSNNPNVKYHGTYNTDGFGVIIRNLSEADLNVVYRCVYDFNWSTPKYLLHGDVFKESTEVPDKDKENNTVVVEIVWHIFGAIAGICIVGGIIIGIIAYCMRRKNKIQKSKGTEEGMKVLKDSDNKAKDQQGTEEEMRPLNTSGDQIKNEQGTEEEMKVLKDSDNKAKDQQGTEEGMKVLKDSDNKAKDQQDMAGAKSNIGKCSVAQVVLEPLYAEKAKEKCRLAMEKELRIALVGKTGVGKSATANTICQANCFYSGVSAKSMTAHCQQKKVTSLCRDISIIDTPGIIRAKYSLDDVKIEIQKCVYLGAPGLHAILFIMEIGRVTDEDITTMNTFLKFFGNEMKNRVIVVFTHGDKLVKENQRFSKYLEEIPEEFKEFLANCQNRVLLFNNNLNKEQSYQQVLSIIEMIEALKTSSEFYNDEAFKKAEEIVQKREEEIRKDLEIKYNEKVAEFKKTMTIRLKKEMRQEKEKKIKEIKKKFEDMLGNVREEVRKEILRSKDHSVDKEKSKDIYIINMFN